MKDKSDQAVPDPGREPGDTEAARMWASIGHEIRTPLMGVVGMLELLGRTALSETQRRLIDTAQESSAALMRIVDDVLDLTAMRTGRLSFHPGPADIGDVVESCAELLARPAEAKGLVLTCEVDPALPEATCDPVRLRQVLLNLGGNALKFTENGQIRFTAERLNADAGWVGIRLTVADTGVGIPEELQAFLFEPFSRLAGTPGRGQGGLGLGLAICRNLIENMGGKIALETAPDTGTKVILTLTFPAATPAPAHRPLEKSKFLFVSDR
jgi:signal transduction histidine kinase